MTNILNMIFCSLRIIIPLLISFYYLIKKGFKENAAHISLLQMIAFINAVFFVPTLVKFFKRLLLNKKIEKNFKTASEKDLKENDICIICRLKMYPKMAKKLPCGHCYHLECLERWIGENDSCPICLAKISELLEKETKRKQKGRRRRKHKIIKNENESVFNYKDLNDENNEINNSFDSKIEEEEEEKSDNHEDKDQIINDATEEINQEENNENNDNIKVIDLDKICEREDENDYYYYSDYYDETDNTSEQN